MSGTFVYVANTESRELLVFTMNTNTGELALVEHVLGGKFNALALSPDGRFLFASMRDEPFGIASFSIDPANGTLRPIGEARLPGPLAYLAIDRTGRWLFGASYHNNFVSVSAVDLQGTVREAHQLIPSLSKAHAAITSPDNRFVLASLLGADSIVCWPFDAERGELAMHEAREVRVASGAGPRHFRFHPDGRLVLLLNELDGSLRTFDYETESGTLTERASTSILRLGFKGKPWAADVHFAAAGRYVYTTERTSSAIAAFTCEPSGSTQLIGHIPTEKQPRGLAVDPSGRFVLTVGQKSNRMSVYAIDMKSGLLTKVSEHPVGEDPIWIEIVTV